MQLALMCGGVVGLNPEIPTHWAGDPSRKRYGQLQAKSAAAVSLRVYRVGIDRSIYSTINGGGVETGFHPVSGKIPIRKKK